MKKVLQITLKVVKFIFTNDKVHNLICYLFGKSGSNSGGKSDEKADGKANEK